MVVRCPVHVAADAWGLPVRHPASLKRDPAAQAAFAALGLDAAVVAAYGLILPQAMLDAPRRGCLNIHASLLPRWRGAAPIQAAVLAGRRRERRHRSCRWMPGWTRVTCCSAAQRADRPPRHRVPCCTTNWPIARLPT